MARRFGSSTEQEIEKLLKQKDSENKRRLTEIAKELFHEYHRKKAFRSRKTRRTQMLKLFAVILFTCKTTYNKTIIRFGSCDNRNNCLKFSRIPILLDRVMEAGDTPFSMF